MALDPKYVFQSIDDIEAKMAIPQRNARKRRQLQKRLENSDRAESEDLAELFRIHITEPDYSTITADDVDELTLTETRALVACILAEYAD